MTADRLPAQLGRAAIARAYREATGAARMTQSDEEFARLIERATVEALGSQAPAEGDAVPMADGFEGWWSANRIKRVLNPAGVARMVWEASARYNRKIFGGSSTPMQTAQPLGDMERDGLTSHAAPTQSDVQPKGTQEPYGFESGLVQLLNEARCLSKETVGNRELAGRVMKYIRMHWDAVTQAPAPGAESIARVERTSAGPKLFIRGVMVRWWLGCIHDREAEAVAAEINGKPYSAPAQAPAVGAGDEPQDIGGHIRAAANARVAQQAVDDSRRLDYVQKKQATISLVPDGRDGNGTRHAFMVGGWHCSINRDVRASIDAAMSESHVPVQHKEDA